MIVVLVSVTGTLLAECALLFLCVVLPQLLAERRQRIEAESLGGAVLRGEDS